MMPLKDARMKKKRSIRFQRSENECDKVANNKKKRVDKGSSKGHLFAGHGDAEVLAAAVVAAGRARMAVRRGTLVEQPQRLQVGRVLLQHLRARTKPPSDQKRSTRRPRRWAPSSKASTHSIIWPISDTALGRNVQVFTMERANSVRNEAESIRRY